MPNSEAFWAYARQVAKENRADPKTGPWMEAKTEALHIPANKGGRKPPRQRRRHYRRTRHRGGWVSLDPSFSRMIGDLMNATAPATAAAFDNRLPPMAKRVLDNWPRMSGTSSATVDLAYGTTGRGTYIGQIAVRAPYANVIPGGPATKLVWKRARKVGRLLAEDCAAELVKDLEG